MAASTEGVQHGQRHASLRLSKSEQGPVLTARVPLDLSEADFQHVARSAYGLIHRLTGCNCMSGRISFVVENDMNEVIQVNLEQQAGRGGD